MATNKNDKNTKNQTGLSWPFLFYGHDIPCENTDCHMWLLRFKNAPTAKDRPAVTQALLKALNNGMFEQSEDFPWRWHKDWLVATAVEAQPSPDAASQERVQALLQLDNVLLELHTTAPLIEVVSDQATAPTGTDWDSWSRKKKPLPAGTMNLFTETGTVDAATEVLRLAQYKTALVGSAHAGGPDAGIQTVDLDKKLWPKKPKLLPGLEARFAKYEAIQTRDDRLCSVTDTAAGQVLWCMAESSLRYEISLEDRDGVHSMDAPAASEQNYERGLACTSEGGKLLVCDPCLVLELDPKTKSRRVLWAEERPCIGTGPREAIFAGNRIVAGTEDGVFLLSGSGRHSLPVAFWPHSGFKHIVPTPCDRGIVVSTFQRSDDPPDIAILAITRDQLQLVASQIVDKGLLSPGLFNGRIIAKQGRAWMEIRGISIPEAAHNAGKPALVPVDVSDPARDFSFKNGKRVVAECASGNFLVFLTDEIDHYNITLYKDNILKHTFEQQRLVYPAFLDVSPDKTKVLITGNRGKGFMPSELVLADALLRPLAWSDPRVGRLVYLADDRILWPLAMQVVTTQGQVLSQYQLHNPIDVRDTVVSEDRQKVLIRHADGSVTSVRLDIDGNVVFYEKLSTAAARIMADGNHLLAVVDGVICEPALA